MKIKGGLSRTKVFAFVDRNFGLITWIGLSLLSAYLLFDVGKRGFFFHDLSIPFDGGFRILKGQLPFKDFVSPTGPVLFVQQALVFALFGVNYNAYLLHAAIMNSLAIMIAYLLLRPFSRATAFWAALATAFLFYLPPGAPYIDTTALFWGFAGLLFVVHPANSSRGRPWRLALGGVCAALSVLTKQNIGAFVALGLVVVLIASSERRLPDLGKYLLGLGAVALIFTLYLVIVGGMSDFLHYAIKVPLEERRFVHLVPEFLKPLWHLYKGRNTWLVGSERWGDQLPLYALMLWLSVLIILNRSPRSQVLALIALFLTGVQLVARVTGNNEWQLYMVFYGVILGCIAQLLFEESRAGTVFMAILSVILLVLGYGVSEMREVHAIDTEKLTYTVAYPAFSGVRFDQETGHAVDALLKFIEEEVAPDDELFIYPWATVLNGISGRASTQPMLWFNSGVTYSGIDPARTDLKLLAALENNNINWFVTADEPISDFPRVDAFIDANFTPYENIDDYFYVFRRMP